MKNWFKKIYRSRANLTKEEMIELINNYENVILLDVRSPQEFLERHLDNAINIPTYELYVNAPKILQDKDSIIITYCEIGVRSRNAIKILKKLGYKNIYHLEGGISSK